MHIVDMVNYWARTTPTRAAIMEPAGTVTYASLAHAVDAAAEFFSRAIEDKKRPVAISLQSGSKLMVAAFGLLRAGFSVVLANKASFPHLAAVGVKSLVYERDTPTWEGGANIPFDENWLGFGIKTAKTPRPIPVTSTTGGDFLCFTSGTTGRPKIVVCPQSSWEQRVLFPLNSAFSNYERILIVPGLTTSWGLSRAYEALHSGRTVCLAPAGTPTLWMINTYDVDTILASPKQALELAEIQEKETHFPLVSLRAVQIGAASINRDSVLRIKKSLCRNVVIFYGSTEAGVAALAPYDAIADVPNAVGFVMPGVEVEIVDAAGQTLPVGKEGFVRVRSRVFAENMAAGKSTADWFYPGDLGWLTDRNMLCIAGRNSDVVNRGGNKLAITDLEDFLLTCFGVKDAGACAVTGDGGFSEVWVGLVLAPSADVAALRHTLEANAHYKNNIDKIFVVEAIPRGTLGKIQRDELKTMLQEIGEQRDSIN